MRFGLAVTNRSAGQAPAPAVGSCGVCTDQLAPPSVLRSQIGWPAALVVLLVGNTCPAAKPIVGETNVTVLISAPGTVQTVCQVFPLSMVR